MAAATGADADEIVRLALARETLALCAFSDCNTGAKSLVDALCEVLNLTGDEDKAKAQKYVAESPLAGSKASQSLRAFVTCVNGYSSFTSRGEGSFKGPNMVLMRSAVQWHRHLQKSRARIAVLSLQNAPDDISSELFPVAISKQLANEERFARQSVFGAAAKHEPRASVIRRQSTTDGGPPSPTRRKLTKQQTQSFKERYVVEEDEEDGDEDGFERVSTMQVDEDGGAPSPSSAPALTARDVDVSAQKVEEEAPAAPSFPRRPSQVAPASMTKSVEMGQEESVAHPINLQICGSFSCHGMEDDKGKTNQDCACVAYPLKKDEEASFFLVLDGHGEQGDIVSNALMWQVYERITNCSWDASKLGESELSAQVVSAFEGAHEQVKTELAKESLQSGAVGVMLLLRRGKMILGHAGDARAILGTTDEGGKPTVVELTHDHKLEDEEERARIEGLGGWIRPHEDEPYFTPARVYADKSNPRKGPGLTMSRSLGDVDADAIGVGPTPTVSFRPLDKSRDKFVVLASDGVWEFLTNEQVGEIVSTFQQQGQPAIVATRFLVAKAAMAWRVEEGSYRDDITATVIYLSDLPGTLGGGD